VHHHAAATARVAGGLHRAVCTAGAAALLALGVACDGQLGGAAIVQVLQRRLDGVHNVLALAWPATTTTAAAAAKDGGKQVRGVAATATTTAPLQPLLAGLIVHGALLGV